MRHLSVHVWHHGMPLETDWHHIHASGRLIGPRTGARSPVERRPTARLQPARLVAQSVMAARCRCPHRDGFK